MNLAIGLFIALAWTAYCVNGEGVTEASYAMIAGMWVGYTICENKHKRA